MSSLSLRSRTAAAGLAALITAAVVGAIFINSPNTNATAAAPVEPSPTAISHYAVFRRAATASDYLPPVSLTDIANYGDGLTRAQSTRGSAFSQWATLEGDTLCVVDRFTPVDSPNGAPSTDRACNSAKYLETSNQLITEAALVGSTSSTPPVPGLANVISGLTPDGVTAVTLAFTDGSKQTAQVEENGFICTLGVAKTLTSVSWTDSSGKIITEKN